MTDTLAPAREAAKFTGKHCVLAYPDGEPVSSLYDSRDEAATAHMRLRVDYPRATLAYWPTAAEHAAYERARAAADDLELTSYRVVEDHPNMTHWPISPGYATREQAQVARAVLLPDHPGAWIIREVLSCRTADEYQRAAAEIVQP